MLLSVRKRVCSCRNQEMIVVEILDRLVAMRLMYTRNQKRCVLVHWLQRFWMQREGLAGYASVQGNYLSRRCECNNIPQLAGFPSLLFHRFLCLWTLPLNSVSRWVIVIVREERTGQWETFWCEREERHTEIRGESQWLKDRGETPSECTGFIFIDCLLVLFRLELSFLLYLLQ